MQLTVWTYEGPPHVGAMRIATAMHGVHYVLHAPQGDTYADLLFTMIERRDRRPPVTYTTFQARDLGGDTAELFKTAARDAYERFQPEAMLVGASCTAELIQDDPGGLARALALPIPVVPLELPAYQRKENWGAAETFYQLVRALAGPSAPPPGTPRAARPAGQRARAATCSGPRRSASAIATTCRRSRSCSATLGVDVHVVAPMGATPADLARLPRRRLQRRALSGDRGHGRAVARSARSGSRAPGRSRSASARRATSSREVAALAGVDPAPALAGTPSRAALVLALGRLDLPHRQARLHLRRRDARGRRRAHRRATSWASTSSDSAPTAASSRARCARRRKLYGVEALITDDYLEVEAKVAELQPELVLGTQMERHIAKRLGVPCAVISAPVHVQDFPARYSPQMGFEGANVLFDTWVHPLMMGLEEHLLAMFRDDFEFHDGAAPSHLGAAAVPRAEPARTAAAPRAAAARARP